MTDKKHNDLVIKRVIKAKRSLIWKAWSNPDHLKEWWCPKPWQTEVRAFDFRTGGAFHTHMSGPDGGESPNPGLFLEVTPQERIIFTTALIDGYRPGTPWLSITAIFEMSDAPGGHTNYTATCLHKDLEDSKRHEEMGFYEGWGICMTQLEAFAQGLA